MMNGADAKFRLFQLTRLLARQAAIDSCGTSSVADSFGANLPYSTSVSGPAFLATGTATST